MSDNYEPPALSVGDQVLWHSDPLNPDEPCIGWVCSRPGQKTTTLLVFSPESGFQMRPSVRHLQDPGLLENPQWRQWGAWELSPATTSLRKLDGLSTQVALLAGRNKKD